MIQHYDQLVSRFSNAQRQGRQVLLTMMEAALASVAPENLIEKAIRYEKGLNTLTIRAHQFKLPNPPRILVIGGGKATGRMALQIERTLGPLIQGGIIVVPRAQAQELRAKLRRIEVAAGDHPIPSREGVESVERLFTVIDESSPDTFVLCLISGGGSSLLPAPAQGISLEDLQTVTRLLLASGATIHEMNITRKHLSRIKGGHLAARLAPRPWATLILSDVVGDNLDVIASGPTVPDSSTFQDVKRILERYNLVARIPAAVTDHLRSGLEGKVPETIKDPLVFSKGKNIIIGSIKDACEAAHHAAETMGIPCQIISTNLIGEAARVGRDLAQKLEEMTKRRPCASIFGGETTVTLQGSGRGGRNQELAVSAARYLKTPRTFLASIATDGLDGNAPAAGGLVDWTTMERAKKQELDIEDFLARNDSYNFLFALGDVLETGATGTNVMDVQILLVI